MSPELIAIITLGIGLGSLLLGGIAFLFSVQQRSERLNKERFDFVCRRIDAQDETIRSLLGQVNDLGKQIARMGGLLDGLREAITRQPSQV